MEAKQKIGICMVLLIATIITTIFLVAYIRETVNEGTKESLEYEFGPDEWVETTKVLRPWYYWPVLTSIVISAISTCIYLIIKSGEYASA